MATPELLLYISKQTMVKLESIKFYTLSMSNGTVQVTAPDSKTPPLFQR